MPPLIMYAIWIVIGIVIGALADPIWKGRRPFGEWVDYVVSVVVAVLTGILDWIIIPRLMEGTAIRFLAAVLEPPLASLFVLWILRLVRKES